MITMLTSWKLKAANIDSIETPDAQGYHVSKSAAFAGKRNEKGITEVK